MARAELAGLDTRGSFFRRSGALSLQREGIEEERARGDGASNNCRSSEKRTKKLTLSEDSATGLPSLRQHQLSIKIPYF